MSALFGMGEALLATPAGIPKKGSHLLFLFGV